MTSRSGIHRLKFIADEGLEEWAVRNPPPELVWESPPCQHSSRSKANVTETERVAWGEQLKHRVKETE